MKFRQNFRLLNTTKSQNYQVEFQPTDYNVWNTEK
jgi:hypothetical protein